MTSKIKVDNINKVSDDSNIINKCGTTITLGASGDTINLAAGASQSGFGRSGSVNWQTGSIKTGTFSAVDGEGYFVNSGSAVTMNLPAGSAGAIVAVSDYARNFATYNLTIAADGSENIGGQPNDAILNIDGQSATFVYVDATKGWVNVQNAEDTETGVPPYIGATGGTITYCGNFKIHTFNGPGTFCVSRVATAAPTPEHNTVSYMVVGGGGGGGDYIAGGGGAGGFREGKNAPICSYTASPLNAPAGIPVSASPYPITVGGGGAGASGPYASLGSQGCSSTFGPITSAGGGYGSGINCTPGGAGGSGGGGQGGNGPSAGGAGDTPPTSPAQGTAGGSARTAPGDRGGGGGGGAICAGQPGQPPYTGGNGGDGATTQINPAVGSPATNFAGGGGGGGNGSAPERGGVGGSGGGGDAQDSANPDPDNGVGNTGGGGGGGSVSGPPTTVGGNGGSGVVIIRYRYQ